MDWIPVLPSPGQLEAVLAAPIVVIGNSNDRGISIAVPRFFHQFDLSSPHGFNQVDIAQTRNWHRSREFEHLVPQRLPGNVFDANLISADMKHRHAIDTSAKFE